MQQVYRHYGVRPGDRFHAHGTTDKRICVLDHDRLVWVVLRKQRWLDPDTRQTCHCRPIWDVPGSPYGLDVQVFLLGRWLVSALGLLRVDWPWADARPSRRSVQRWAARLAPDATAWLQAAREALIERLAPEPLESNLPTGGIPPPEGRTRCSRLSAPACQLRGVTWLLSTAARVTRIPLRCLLEEAHRRFPETTPTPCTDPS